MGVGFGLANGSSGATTLWRACAAALGVAVLTRWWGGIWLNGLREAMENPPVAPTVSNAATPPTKTPNKV